MAPPRIKNVTLTIQTPIDLCTLKPFPCGDGCNGDTVAAGG